LPGISSGDRSLHARTLVLGVGNLLLGDEGFGVHAARRLAAEGLPDWVRVEDGGTAGVDLLDMIATHERVIVIDALRVRAIPPGPSSVRDRGLRAMGGSACEGESPRTPVPGDVVVFRLNTVELLNPDPGLSLHECSLGGLVNLAAALRLDLPPIDVVGYVPGAIRPSTELSSEGAKGLDVAVARVHEMLASS
jgi:Ni,Fe-hydrogenase maturation factor